MCYARCITNNSGGLLPSQAHISPNDLTTLSSTPTSQSPLSPQTTSISTMLSPQEVVPVEVIKTKKRVSWEESVRCTFIKGCTKDTWYDEDDYDQFQNDVFNTIDQYNMIKSNRRRGATPRRSSMSLLSSSMNTRRNASATPPATKNDAPYSDEKVCIRGLEHFADKASKKAKRQARVTAWLTVLDLQDEQWEAQIAAVAAASSSTAALYCSTVEQESETDGYSSSASSNGSLSMAMDMTISTASPRCVEDFPINNYNDPESRRRILEANSEALAKAYQKVTFRAKQEAFLRGLQDQVAAAC